MREAPERKKLSVFDVLVSPTPFPHTLPSEINKRNNPRRNLGGSKYRGVLLYRDCVLKLAAPSFLTCELGDQEQGNTSNKFGVLRAVCLFVASSPGFSDLRFASFLSFRN